MAPRHRERHRLKRVGWLRAAVLGANDGIVSTASLLVGVAAADASHGSLLTAGIAGAVAGAMSMAAGEYVSVSSQADSEQADLARERQELETDDAGEHRELMGIYMSRGLDQKLAKQVAEQLMAHDALGAHARDELGITDRSTARPLQAAAASAASFSLRRLAAARRRCARVRADQCCWPCPPRRSCSSQRSAPSPRGPEAPPWARPPHA